MKLFLDSADSAQIEEAYSTGIIEGITTNPSLIKKAVDMHKKSSKKKLNLDEYLTEIFVICKGTPVSIEVTKTESLGMIAEGNTLYNKYNLVANNVVIKIPVNTSSNGKTKMFEGIKAIKALSDKRIPVNATLVFTPEQALMAAKAGARYVSLFVGRVDDYLREKNHIEFQKSDYYPQNGHGSSEQGWDNGIASGVDLVKQTVHLFKMHNVRTEILAASIRNARQLREVALAGAHVATVPLEVLNHAINHPKTQEGIKAFTDDLVAEYVKLANEKSK